MRHRVFGRKLSRNTNERRRLFMVLSRELIARGQIKTTLAKAKAVQSMVEKLITKAKRGSASSKRQMYKVLADGESVQALLAWAKTRFSARSSGFTRIVKLGARAGDASEEVFFSFVDPAPAIVPQPLEKKEEKKPAKIEKPKVVKAKKVVKKTSVKKSALRKKPALRK